MHFLTDLSCVSQSIIQDQNPVSKVYMFVISSSCHHRTFAFFQNDTNLSLSFFFIEAIKAQELNVL